MTNRSSDLDVSRKKVAFYGWYIVAALFFASFLAIGSRQGFGVFVKTWEEDWGVTTAAISLAASIGVLCNGLSQPIGGWLADRYGGRPVLVFSLTVMALSTIAVSTVSSVFGLIILYGVLISFAAGGVSHPAMAVVIARWFDRNRGAAMSILVAGGSVGGLVVVPFLSYALIEFGWRAAWVIIGLFALGFGVPLLLMVVRNKPADLGMLIDGEEHEQSSGDVKQSSAQYIGPDFVYKWHHALNSKPIWQLSFGYFVCGITTSAVAVHFVRWAISEDITPATAALAFGALSAVNALGVLVVGVLSDRFQRKNLLGAVYLIRALAFISLIVVPGDQAIWAFAAIGGMSWLATVPLTASLTADVYGVRNLGTLFGFANMSHQIGGAAAVLFFGWAFTRFGSYDIPFMVGALTLLSAGIVSLSIREKTHSVRYVQVIPEGRAGDESRFRDDR